MKASATFRKGWNSGLQAAAQALLSSLGNISPEDVLYALRPLLIPAPKLRRTDQETADKYGISKRSVLNWRKDGCPFEKGMTAVMDWMLGRRYLPAPTKEKFKLQLARRRMRVMLVELDDGIIEVQALAKMHREVGLPVEPWMRMRRLTRRKADLLMEQARQKILQRMAELE